MITPEQVCAYYSTLVAEQRLKVSGGLALPSAPLTPSLPPSLSLPHTPCHTPSQDAGYRGKSLFTVEEEEEDSSQKIDDEASQGCGSTCDVAMCIIT